MLQRDTVWSRKRTLRTFDDTRNPYLTERLTSDDKAIQSAATLRKIPTRTHYGQVSIINKGDDGKVRSYPINSVPEVDLYECGMNPMQMQPKYTSAPTKTPGSIPPNLPIDTPVPRFRQYGLNYRQRVRSQASPLSDGPEFSSASHADNDPHNPHDQKLDAILGELKNLICVIGKNSSNLSATAAASPIREVNEESEGY